LRAVETSKSGGENVLSRGGGASGACFGRELLFILFFQMYLTTDELGKRREDEEEEIDTYLKVIYLKRYCMRWKTCNVYIRSHENIIRSQRQKKL
jgi:hypothetical protein